MLYLYMAAERSLVGLGADAEGSATFPGLQGALLLCVSQRSQGAKVKTLLVLFTLGDEASSVRSKPATFQSSVSGKLKGQNIYHSRFYSSTEVFELTFCSDRCKLFAIDAEKDCKRLFLPTMDGVAPPQLAWVQPLHICALTTWAETGKMQKLKFNFGNNTVGSRDRK